MSLLVTSGNYTDLTWTTPVSSIISADFVLENEYATKHVSIEDILSHRTYVQDPTTLSLRLRTGSAELKTFFQDLRWEQASELFDKSAANCEAVACHAMTLATAATMMAVRVRSRM